MDKNIRLIIRNNHDCDGITEAIINEFRNRGLCVKGIVIDCNSEERERDKDFEYISPVVSGDSFSQEILRAVQPLDGSIMEAMLPYKDMAMHMGMRATHYDVYERKYLEDLYYTYLKYWNEILDRKEITHAIFMVTPHHMGEYVLYSLCRIKGIRCVLMYPQLSYNGDAFILGESLDAIGNEIKQLYGSLPLSPNKELSTFLSGVIANTKANKVIGDNQKKMIMATAKKSIYKQINIKRLLTAVLIYIICVLGLDTNNRWLDYKSRLLYIIKARKYERKMDHISDYKKYSVEPNYDETYIYFPLQMTPEASTMPYAGEFKNQLLSVELLSYVAKKYGIKVYVKEHWVQYNRDPHFYKSLNEIENVRLIDVSVNSVELIENAFLVASQTGNCLFEAMIKRKYAISIGGNNSFAGAPNIFRVKNMSDIIDAIEFVKKTCGKIKEDDINRYLLALDRCLIFSYLDSLDEAYKDYDKYLTASQIVDFFIGRKE